MFSQKATFNVSIKHTNKERCFKDFKLKAKDTVSILGILTIYLNRKLLKHILINLNKIFAFLKSLYH